MNGRRPVVRRGAELYDKVGGFVEDLRRIGHELRSAQAAYDEAERKLVTGKGNAIRQAELLRELGVKPTKHLPRQLVDRASPEGVVLPPAASVEAEDVSDNRVEVSSDRADGPSPVPNS